jgi:glycerol-3-phosphate dehydrogenase
MRVDGLLKSAGRICVVRALEMETGREYPLQGRSVINATGVFSDHILRMDEPSDKPLLTTSQGIHLVVDKPFLRGNSALMVPKTDDGRVLFAIPWLDKVVLGTTDTPVAQASLEPRPLDSEVDFILEHAARYLDRPPTRSDVSSVFAGLRPLVNAGKSLPTSAISRDYTVSVSGSGLVTVTGGKWTTYRKMGEAAVDQAAAVAGLEKRACRTRQLRIHGWIENPDRSGPFGVYGADAPSLERLIKADPALGDRLHSRLPYLKAQVVWAARQEMGRTVEDVLARRTRALFLDADASLEAAPAVAELLARELGRQAGWQQVQIQAYSALAKGYRLT